MSALDFFMSVARAAAKDKEKRPQTYTTSFPSPKEQKFGGETLVDNDPIEFASGSLEEKDPVESQSRDDKIVQLKRKVGLLKKKPSDFDPTQVSCWDKGERVPFMFLSLAFDLISTDQTADIVITDILSNMFRTVISTTPEDLVATVYLTANEIAPAHQKIHLGIYQSFIIKAISEAFGTTEELVVQQNKELGDLGLVAASSHSSQTIMFKPEPLTVCKVFNTFREIAKETGKGRYVAKKNRMKELFVATRDYCEPLYLTRLLEAKLRLGFSCKTVLAALGQASVYNEEHSKPPPNIENPLEEAGRIVKQVFSVVPDIETIVGALLNGSVWNLPKTCSFKPGVPVSHMLPTPITNVAVIPDQFKDNFTCEYKYDGERGQIHYMEDGKLEIFSRNGMRYTDNYPEVASALFLRSKKASVKSFVLDCELVAFDRETNKILSYQILVTQARKSMNVKIGVCIFAFDMLYLNGQLLIEESLNMRREKLYNSFEEDPGYFQFVAALTSNDNDEMQEFLNSSVDMGCEGLVIKTLNSDATYEPGNRSNNWLKLKKEYMDSIGDSLDLVPIAAFHGCSKRTGLYDSFLLACYDAEKQTFQSISNMGLGFSEADLKKLSSRVCSKVIASPKNNYQVDDNVKPDVWFEPSEVWEVKAGDMTISPVYSAAIGIVDRQKGISVRFPRLIRVREDKTPEEATSSVQIAEMFKAQKYNHTSYQVKGDDH